jgi:ABC-type maltose transport system permease subunit
MYKKHSFTEAFIRNLFVWIFIGFAMFPFIWIFSASINPSNTLLGQSLIPKNFTWDRYIEFFTNEQHPFGLWILNSIKVSGITAIFTVILAALGAYAFSRFRFKGRRTGLLSLLLVQMFPQILAIVAIYLLLLNIGKHISWLGLNHHISLIMVYLGGAMGFNMWLMKGYFDTISYSLEESAMIDGVVKRIIL